MDIRKKILLILAMFCDIGFLCSGNIGKKLFSQRQGVSKFIRMFSTSNLGVYSNMNKTTWTILNFVKRENLEKQTKKGKPMTKINDDKKILLEQMEELNFAQQYSKASSLLNDADLRQQYLGVVAFVHLAFNGDAEAIEYVTDYCDLYYGKNLEDHKPEDLVTKMADALGIPTDFD